MNVKEQLVRESNRIAEANEEFKTFLTVAEKLPQDLQIQSVTKHAYRGELRIQLEEVDKVEDVRACLATFPPVKLVRYKASCLSFYPHHGRRRYRIEGAPSHD